MYTYSGLLGPQFFNVKPLRFRLCNCTAPLRCESRRSKPPLSSAESACTRAGRHDAYSSSSGRERESSSGGSISTTSNSRLDVGSVERVAYATTLMSRGVWISTVEHLLSALYALGVDNAVIELDNFEVPILDGSALPYTEAIRQTGIVQLQTPRNLHPYRKAVRTRRRTTRVSRSIRRTR